MIAGVEYNIEAQPSTKDSAISKETLEQMTSNRLVEASGSCGNSIRSRSLAKLRCWALPRPREMIRGAFKLQPQRTRHSFVWMEDAMSNV